MLEKAIEKIKSEMNQNKNPYVQVVGEFLLQHLEVNPESAEKVLNKEKTIIKSLDEMKKAAEKKKIGNCAVLTDTEGFEIVMKYFGIDSKTVIAKLALVSTRKGETPERTSVDFDVKLDDLLV